jgi:hypothetical protein
MKQRKWYRVHNLAGYVKSEDIMPPEEDRSLARRYYTPMDKRYPILAISIHPDILYYMDKKPLTGVKISCSLKSKKSEWWDEYEATIPLELFEDLWEMLQEAKLK